MPARSSIPVNPRLAKRVHQRVKSGQFASPEAVIQAGLALLDEQERAKRRLNAKIAAGLKAASEGHLSDGAAFFDELEAEEHLLKRRRRSA